MPDKELDTSKYWTMKQADLEKENQRLDEEIERLRAAKQSLTRAMDIKINEATAAARLAEMSDAEKIALRNVLGRG